MLGEALQRVPAEVEPIEVRIWCFEPGNDPDRVRIVVEAAGVGERAAQRILASVTERRVTEIVSEAQGFGQVLVEAERARHRPPDLRDLQAVGQANAVMVAVGRDEHLSLVAEAAEADRVDQPVAVALENVARPARTRIAFGMEAAARIGGISSDAGRKSHSVASGAILSVWELVNRKASMPTLFRSSAKVSASDEPWNGPTSNRARSALLET